MTINVVIVGGTSGGTNTNVIRVIAQSEDNSDTVVNAQPNTGYVLTDTSLQSIILPPSVFGDIYYFQGDGTGLFRIIQTASQQISFGDKQTEFGVGGFIQSTNAKDGLFLICTAPNIFSVMPGAQGASFSINTASGLDVANSINNLVGLPSSGTNAIAITNQTPVAHGNETVSIGFNAGSITQGNFSVALGFDAGENDQGTNSVSVGHSAGRTNQGTDSVAIGHDAALTDQGNNCVAVGVGAGGDSQGIAAVAIGYLAGSDGQLADAVAIGQQAGRLNQSGDNVAIGRQAGEISQGISALALGCQAGQNNQGTRCVAIGHRAAETSQANESIAIGARAGMTGITSERAILFGTDCVDPGTNGRLAFGDTMETITSIGATNVAQSGYINIAWNGTHYRIPIFPATHNALIP